ncbi:MAG: hypothetical protein IIX06_02015 [Bacteroidales bacterium]|nr:hypothetical protein [Bacteroidales bacterium]
MSKLLFEDVYLYNCYNGKLIEHRGYIVKNDYRLNHAGIFFAYAKDENGNDTVYNCTTIEGEVYGKVVWLSESNIHKAAEILIKHEEEQIYKLKLKIAGHEVILNNLKQY